jgi:hypothetical protein
MLTASRLRKLLSFEKSTGFFFWRVRTSNRIRVGSVAGCVNEEGYRVIQVGGVKHYASRLAVLHSTGRWPMDEVRHANGIRNDDSWNNIRAA